MSSRPRRCPHRTNVRTERRIVAAFYPALGSSSNRGPPALGALDSWKGPCQVSDAPAGLPGPRHRPCPSASPHYNATNTSNLET